MLRDVDEAVNIEANVILKDQSKVVHWKEISRRENRHC